MSFPPIKYGLVLLLPAVAWGASVTLAWSPVTGAAGYELYSGGYSRNYTNMVDAGSSTSGTVHGLVDGATYFFAVTAYDATGLQSDFSSEVQYTIPADSPGPLINVWEHDYTNGDLLWATNLAGPWLPTNNPLLVTNSGPPFIRGSSTNGAPGKVTTEKL